MYQRRTPEEEAATRAVAVEREAHRRAARAARAVLLADLPWLAGVAFPAAATWRPLIDLVVQPTGPLHAWYWGGNIPSDADRLVIAAGTALERPTVVVHGPPVGAYVCEPVPDDDRDDEPWWRFRLLAPAGSLEAGAAIEMRPGDGAAFVPDGHPALRDQDLIARATLSLDA